MKTEIDKDKENKLKEVYRKIPTVQCKGLCLDACSYISMTKLEADIMTRESGEEPRQKDGKCNYLVDGRCIVYAVRPVICRLFGVDEGLRCPFGCVPIIPFRRGYQILNEAENIGGEMIDNATEAEILEALLSK